ncbi:MAG: methyl-accepting chemotaxis protein, partial [Erythrobacter sp.]|nr:methyl-accepting chemotaxis protein [Erythrobacter sp.]
MTANLKDLRFSTKITGFLILSLVVLMAINLAITVSRMYDEAYRDAAVRQETSMRVAWDVVKQYGDSFSERDGKLYIGEQRLAGFSEPVDRIKELTGDKATVFHRDMRIATNVVNPDGSRAVGTALTDEDVREAVLVNGQSYRGRADILGIPHVTSYDPIRNASGEVIGILASSLPIDQVHTDVASAAAIITLGGVLVTIVMALLGFFFLRSTFEPLDRLCKLLDMMQAGHHDFAVEGTQRKDEIGKIARSLELFRNTAAAREREEAEHKAVVATIAERLGRLAEGDLDARIEEPFPGNYEVIRLDYNRATGALAEAMASVVGVGSAINNAANEIREASDDLSRRTERQAVNLSETVEAMNDITGTVRVSADRAIETRGAVEQTGADAQKSAELVGRLVDAMRAIESSAEEISEIIAVIDGIAFQTNLLALNAGVEAARAGEAGKGFAVVASEVRALAQRSAEAAQDVKLRIATSSQQVHAGVKLVNEAGNSFDQIFGRIAEISEAITSIAEASERQSKGLEQVNSSVGEMNSVTQQNAAMVEQATAAARSMADEA